MLILIEDADNQHRSVLQLLSELSLSVLCEFRFFYLPSKILNSFDFFLSVLLDISVLSQPMLMIIFLL